MSDDPYKYFRTEARDLVEKLSRGVLDLEKGRGDEESVARLLRCAHTLKGAARVVKQTGISELSHAIEEILEPYREERSVPSSRISPLLARLDAITSQLSALDAPTAAAPPAGESSHEQVQTARVGMTEMDALLTGITDLRVHLSGLERQVAALGSVSQQAAGLAAEVRGRPGASGGAAPGGRVAGTAEEIDHSLKTIQQAMRMHVDRVERQWTELYEQASQMRLVAAQSLFGALERAVRDAAKELNKHVEFAATGGETRLDAHALSLLRNALIHVVRNAVAHGIEPPGERVTAGTPPAGRIELCVRRVGDQAVFTCRDDGRGIGLDRVRQVLLARRAVAPAQAAELTPDRALGMLLRGGVSTTQRVTELSGRGIGLDVVRETAACLQGSVTAQTKVGRGTTLEIAVPVSIESVEVMHVEAGGLEVSLPARAVRRALRLRTVEIARSAEGDSIVYDGRVIPWVSLADVLDRPPRLAGHGAPRTALVVEAEAGTAAVGVDGVGARDRRVVHALPDVLGPVPPLLGAFFDSQGDPQLVLDPLALVRAALAGPANLPAVPAVPRPPLLVIDDSLTTRMVEQGILEAAGYDVDTAASGEEALHKARRRSYGLFLVDIEMPGMDGFEFLEAAAAVPALARVPSIVVSSRESPEDRARGERLGVGAYIVKSRFDEDVLLRTIRELVG